MHILYNDAKFFVEAPAFHVRVHLSPSHYPIIFEGNPRNHENITMIVKTPRLVNNLLKNFAVLLANRQLYSNANGIPVYCS